MSDHGPLGRLANRANRLAVSLVRTRTVRMVNERPIVSFAFDDFPKSAVSNGAAILESKGLAGTYYLSSSFAGTRVDGTEYCDMADLRRLIDNGHEIGCHTASHLRVPTVPPVQLLDDLESNARFVREHLGDLRMTTFAFPFGAINVAAKLLLQTRFAACRASLPGVNRGSADLGALKAERLYSNSPRAERIRTLISRAAKPRSWLILYTHDVSDSPGPFGCTPALLETALNFALKAGFQVFTVRNALRPIRFRE